MNCTQGMVLIALGARSALSAAAAPAAKDRDPVAAFPNRPIRIVIGFTSGGQPSIVARILAARLSETIGQQVIVDNRPGAGGTIGTKIVADSTPDGHTLLSSSPSHVIQPAIYAKLPYDTRRDFSGITTTATASYMLVVGASVPAKSVQELIALAKAKPGQLNFSSSGTGSATHFASELFKLSAQIDVVHVPYKGVPEALTDVVGGRVQFILTPPSTLAAVIRDGKVRALGVTGKERVRSYPDVPTIAESGVPGYFWETWAGVFAPSKTPRAIIMKLNREMTAVLRMPDIQQRLLAMEAEPAPCTPAELDALVAREIPKIAELARKAGITPQ